MENQDKHLEIDTNSDLNDPMEEEDMIADYKDEDVEFDARMDEQEDIECEIDVFLKQEEERDIIGLEVEDFFNPIDSDSQEKTCIPQDADFISKLPDELLHKILSYASLRENVQTSVLSHRWRYVSAYNPSLLFNWKEMFYTEAKNYEFWKALDNPCIRSRENIVGGITKYINFYRGEKIHSFEVNFCFCYKSFIGRYREFCGDFRDQINGWIKFALDKGVESLSLFTECLFDCCGSCLISRLSCTRYVFRTELFDDIAMSLKHLQLRSCKLGPNFTYELSLLESISLDNVDCVADELEYILPYLGKLKTLEIANSTLPEKLSLVSLPLLQKFLIQRYRSLKEIELLNPNLIEFKCSGRESVKCNFSGAPNLTSLFDSLHVGELDLLFTHFSQHNPELRNLTLVILDDWANWCPPRRVQTLVRQVTQLNLQFFNRSDFCLGRVMAILKTFPLLRSFGLKIVPGKDLVEGRIEHDLSYVPEYLTEVAISNYSHTKLQRQFAKYLLENLSTLKKVTFLLPAGTEINPSFDPFYQRYYARLFDELEEFDRRKILDLQKWDGIPLKRNF